MSNNSDERFEKLSRVFKALCNPNRLRLFMQLASCCAPGTVCEGGDDEQVSTCVGDLGQELGVSPSTISHHLKELREAGLMETKRQGRKVVCWVDPDILRALAAFFSTPLGD